MQAINHLPASGRPGNQEVTDAGGESVDEEDT
jgi:hypothetical protein